MFCLICLAVSKEDLVQRSLGISISAVLAAVGCISSLWSATTIIAFGVQLGAFALLFGGLGLALALAGGVVSYGLWTQKHWGWDVGVLVELLVLAFVVGGMPLTDTTDVISLLMSGAIVWYLFQPGVRAAIKHPQAAESGAKRG